MPKYSPEFELLLCSIQSPLGLNKQQRTLELIQGELNWDYLLHIARRHKIMLMLCANLESIGEWKIPEHVMEQLTTYRQGSLARSEFLGEELPKILNTFTREGIRAIGYKGPILSVSAYKSSKLRHFRDLDILVSPDDIKKAKQVLLAEGYKMTSELFWENEFRKQENDMVIDLHRQITPRFFPFTMDFEGLWARLQPVNLGSVILMSFAPEDALLVSCVYLSRDCWQKHEKLVQISDIAMLINANPDVNWEELLQRSIELGGKKMLLLGLSLTQQLLHIELPALISREIEEDNQLKKLSSQVCQWFFTEADLGLQRKLFYLKVRERREDILPHLPYLLKYWFTPSKTDHDFLPLPSYLSFAYYGVRQVRLITKYARNIRKN